MVYDKKEEDNKASYQHHKKAKILKCGPVNDRKTAQGNCEREKVLKIRKNFYNSKKKNCSLMAPFSKQSTLQVSGRKVRIVQFQGTYRAGIKEFTEGKQATSRTYS